MLLLLSSYLSKFDALSPISFGLIALLLNDSVSFIHCKFNINFDICDQENYRDNAIIPNIDVGMFFYFILYTKQTVIYSK